MIRFTPRFDAVTLGELTLNFINKLTMRAVAGFVDSRLGYTHGRTTMEGPWSPKTIEKVMELKACIEEDLARRSGTLLTDVPRADDDDDPGDIAPPLLSGARDKEDIGGIGEDADGDSPTG